jgi:catecholate siderophore receptor
VLAAYRDQPAPVPRENFYGLMSRDFERMNSDMATARVEHDFSDGVSLRNQFRYGRSTRDSVTTAPRFASNDNLVINRNGPSWITKDDIYDNQTDFTSRFHTGSIEHAFVGGLVLTREGNVRTGRTVTNTPTTTLYNPNPNEPFSGAYVMNPIVGDVTGNTTALYAFDTVHLGEKWQLNGGLRWERFDVDGVSTTGAPVVRVDQMTGTRAGVVYKPTQMGSIYASYGTSLNPSLEGLSYSVANTAIEPEKTYSFETGSKWDLMSGRLSLTGALFRVDKTNARTPGVLPDDPPQVLQGRQRVSGVELGAGGNLNRYLKIYGAYTFMDTEIVKSNTPAEVGKEIQNAPRNSANLWLTYEFRRFTIAGGPRYVGKRYGNNINTRSVDNYWTLDGLASYAVSRHFDLRVNLYNLNNAYYFDRLGGGHLIPGMARMVMVGSNIRF